MVNWTSLFLRLDWFLSRVVRLSEKSHLAFVVSWKIFSSLAVDVSESPQDKSWWQGWGVGSGVAGSAQGLEVRSPRS